MTILLSKEDLDLISKIIENITIEKEGNVTTLPLNTNDRNVLGYTFNRCLYGYHIHNVLIKTTSDMLSGAEYVFKNFIEDIKALKEVYAGHDGAVIAGDVVDLRVFSIPSIGCVNKYLIRPTAYHVFGYEFPVAIVTEFPDKH